MKRIKRLLTLALALCLALALAAPAGALTLQEQSWLSHLRPKLPRIEGDTSYPAWLSVTTPYGGHVQLNGTCSLGGSLTDEQLVDILKRACAAVDGYKDPQDAVNDKVLAAAIKEKLKLSEEDIERFEKNILSLLGLDKVADILNFTMPGVGGSDMASIAAEIVTEGKPGLGFLNPIPDSIGGFVQGLIINGVFISWEEFQRDKDKYKDIVNLSQANARLRQYYARVDELVRQAMSESTVWAIRIQTQEMNDTLHRDVPVYYAPTLWTADIELIKDDGSYGNVNGTYTGRFHLSYEADLREFDRGFAERMAQYYNDGDGRTIAGTQIGWSQSTVVFSPVANEVNQPSVHRLTLEGSGVPVTLSLPPGVNRTRFELPISATALEQTEFEAVEDRFAEVRGTDPAGLYSITISRTIITDSRTGTDYEQTRDVVTVPFQKPQEFVNTENGSMPRDMRPYIQMTLVVDMTG